MYTNKRQLKKRFGAIAAEVVQSVLPAAVYSGAITDEKAEEYILKISQLSTEAHSRMSIAFDKSLKEFESPAQYRKARAHYYSDAYRKLTGEFESGINTILKEVHEALKK